MPVVLINDPLWSGLDESAGAREIQDQHVERGLLRAAAVAHAGCRPLLVVSGDQFAEYRELLMNAVARRSAHPLIVIGECGTDEAITALTGEADVCDLPEGAREDEVAATMQACLSTGRGSVLRVGVTRVSRVGPRSRKVGKDTFIAEEPGLPASDSGGMPEAANGIPFAVSAESAQSDQQEIEHKRLRLEVLRWIQEYDRVGRRNLYLWRWCLHGIELTTFTDVAESFRTHLHDSKLLSVILCVLFDDVADRHGRTELLETLIQSASNRVRAPAPGICADEHEYVDITRRLWSEYESRVRRYPQYGVFERLWRFDLLQFLNTMRYAHLVNSQPGLLNLTEHDIYTPHNMLMVSFSTLDLMCVPHFQTAELGHLREAMWHSQAMGRIGNVLSTWRRELSESDYSSGMFVGDPSLSMSTRERLLLDKWRWHRSRCHAAAGQVRSLDLIPVLRGHDRFFDMHLASAGRI